MNEPQYLAHQYPSHRCPSRSPETHLHCDLLDTQWNHKSGHESYRGRGEWVSWATTAADRERWNTAQPVHRTSS